MSKLINFIKNTYEFGNVVFLFYSVACAVAALFAPWYIELPLIFCAVFYYNMAME